MAERQELDTSITLEEGHEARKLKFINEQRQKRKRMQYNFHRMNEERIRARKEKEQSGVSEITKIFEMTVKLRPETNLKEKSEFAASVKEDSGLFDPNFELLGSEIGALGLASSAVTQIPF
jgi:hypothetical protein